MNKTSIEWVRNPDGTQGYSWNPITGCLNGCSYCYARKLAYTRLRHVMLRNLNLSVVADRPYDISDPFWPRFWWDRLHKLYDVRSEPAGIGKVKLVTMRPNRRMAPRGIFVCDMGELFGPWLPSEWTRSVLTAVADHPQHRFYLLTKQPQELAKWSPFPENAWVGVSAWDYNSFVNACYALSLVKASVKYISLEPLLSWRTDFPTLFESAGVSWVIVGAQTKPSVRVPQEWVENIISQAHHVGVSVFLKESLRYIVDYGGPREPCFWPDPNDPHLWRLLQEFPDGKVIVGNKAVAR